MSARTFAFSCVLVLSLSCSSAPGTGNGDACGAADGRAIARDLDAGAADVGVEGSSSATRGTDTPPDPANWGCYVDADCSVFPTLPFCEDFRCVPAMEQVACASGNEAPRGSPEVMHTYSGANGTFNDACDQNGNLIVYGCEAMFRCDNGGGPNPSCKEIESGLVNGQPTIIDCAGQCRDGRCEGQCPQQGDAITFTRTLPDGGAVIHNDTDGRAYDCMLDFDLATDAFDCKNVHAGQTGRVVSRSAPDNGCTGADFGGIGVALDGVSTSNGNESCGYSCGIHPGCGR